MEVIEPDVLKTKDFRLEALNGLRSIGRRMVREFKRTTRTWEHQPEFVWERSLQEPGPFVMAYTEDRIYKFINDGTRVRYATMTHDFEPKTTPGVIDAGPGAGGLAFVNVAYPHPGIEARNFDELVKNIIEPIFRAEMDERMRRAVAKSGHAL